VQPSKPAHLSGEYGAWFKDRLIEPLGQQRCGPEAWQPTPDEHLECRHSQRGFSRSHMPPADLAAFDAAVRTVLDELCQQGTIQQCDGRLQLSVEATATWGRPRKAA
jgi:hypothetical protein